jgi:sugar phosphate isomerase/epimerase
MRLGAPVFDWSTPGEWALNHVKKGYGAAYWPLGEGVSEEEENNYVQEANRHGLVIAEVGIWNNLLDRDPNRREENIQYAVCRLRTADRVGARCCVNISGSRSSYWDGPHPDNLSEETFRAVVEITRRIIDGAEPKHTYYTLEPMPWMLPYDVESLQRLIMAVDRPHFAVHADMCNLVNAFTKVYRTGELTKAFFGAFGHLIRSVHAKDTVLREDKLTLHIDEAIPGRGVFDYDALLSECHKLMDVPVMAEHLQMAAEYDEAASFLMGKAEALGIPFEKPVPQKYK